MGGLRKEAVRRRRWQWSFLEGERSPSRREQGRSYRACPVHLGHRGAQFPSFDLHRNADLSCARPPSKQANLSVKLLLPLFPSCLPVYTTALFTTPTPPTSPNAPNRSPLVFEEVGAARRSIARPRILPSSERGTCLRLSTRVIRTVNMAIRTRKRRKAGTCLRR